MLQIRKILLRGHSVKDALVKFEHGANILAGESDTGKSFLVQCLDFILGADKLKYLKQAEGYKSLFVEFENSKQEFLTLVRPLDGGKLRAYQSRIEDISGSGSEIAPKRAGKSVQPDITSVFLPFAGIDSAQLRKNVNGETQRLSVRTLAPLFLVNEVSIIDEYSPVLGRPGYDKTTLKRTLSYLLTGVDDKDVVASEKNEIIKTRLQAKLEVVVDLIAPLEERYKGIVPIVENAEEDIAEKQINQISEQLTDFGNIQGVIQNGMQELTKVSLKADSQLLGISELRNRYELLDERYTSDLERLDFITEGAHFINSLQDVNCPLCDQMMPGHDHPIADTASLRQSALAEASKIKAHKHDLAAAISDIDKRRSVVHDEQIIAESQIQDLKRQLNSDVGPKLEQALKRYEKLVGERSEREARRLDGERWANLLKMKRQLETDIESNTAPKQTWNGISTFSVSEFCKEIETVLREWTWSANPRVEFDEKEYDIIVDGQPRNSHGKGVRAILYSAFTIGLLKYCAANGRPHPGVIVIDSPLTSFKKKSAQQIQGADGQVSAGVEEAFWNSLKSVPKNIQVIVIENKEPPADVSQVVHYEWFAGPDAKDGERAGLIP